MSKCNLDCINFQYDCVSCRVVCDKYKKFVGEISKNIKDDCRYCQNKIVRKELIDDKN